MTLPMVAFLSKMLSVRRVNLQIGRAVVRLIVVAVVNTLRWKKGTT
jgi:hypothetical protein